MHAGREGPITYWPSCYNGAVVNISVKKSLLLGVMVLTSVANHLRLVRLSRDDQFILSYGGLRGAIAFALASLLDTAHFRSTRSLFVTTTIAVIYFTNFVLVSWLLLVFSSGSLQITTRAAARTRLLEYYCTRYFLLPVANFKFQVAEFFAVN